MTRAAHRALQPAAAILPKLREMFVDLHFFSVQNVKFCETKGYSLLFFFRPKFMFSISVRLIILLFSLSAFSYVAERSYEKERVEAMI